MDEQNLTRKAILDALEGCELSAGDLARRLGIRNSSLSHHLASLREQGLIQYRSRSRYRLYSLVGWRTEAGHEPSPAKAPTRGESPFARTFKRFARERGIQTREPEETA